MIRVFLLSLASASMLSGLVLFGAHQGLSLAALEEFAPAGALPDTTQSTASAPLRELPYKDMIDAIPRQAAQQVPKGGWVVEYVDSNSLKPVSTISKGQLVNLRPYITAQGYTIVEFTGKW